MLQPASRKESIMELDLKARLDAKGQRFSVQRHDAGRDVIVDQLHRALLVADGDRTTDNPDYPHEAVPPVSRGTSRLP